MASSSVFSGRLEAFRPVELLQMMGLGPSTGALHLHKITGEEGILYFDQGMLIGCSEHDTEALTLGSVLQQLDLVSSGELAYAFEQQTHDPLGKRIGERLIDLGILTPDQLQDVLRTQTLWIAREIARWDAGWYEVHPGEHLGPHLATPRIETQVVAMEVLRYEDAWKELREYLREGMRTRLAMAYEPPLEHPLRFDIASWRVISKVNAHATVRRIASALRVPEMLVAQQAGELVRMGLLVPLGPGGGPGLPAEAKRLDMRHFDLFTLLIGMEHEWHKRKSLTGRLIAMAGFINKTMAAFGEACQANGLSLAPDTLASLLAEQGLTGIGEYQFKIERNRIDLDDFQHFCKRVLDGSARGAIETAKVFYDSVFGVLEGGLEATFEAINARVASPVERTQNREAWEALFLTFSEQESIG
ncbi:MAG: DUF4388 domain-containing protein [Ktedonobacterales bacterium]